MKQDGVSIPQSFFMAGPIQAMASYP